jgi:hypothetical protein
MEQSKTASSDQYLLVKGSAGMGNRMLCAASGILYGMVSGRKVIIDWTDGEYADKDQNAFDLYFDCPDVVKHSERPSTEDIAPEIWKDHLDKSISWMLRSYDPDKFSSIFIHKKYSIDVKRLNYPQRVAVFWYYTHRLPAIIPYLKNTKYANMGIQEILRRILCDSITLRKEIAQKIADFQSKHFRKSVIGVHIRQTDRIVPIEKYNRPLNRILRENPDAQIYLATDNKTVEEYFEKEYKNEILKTDKWYPDKNEQMHINSNCPDMYQNGVEALVDMYLLSKCDYLIYPGISTFSWISSILSNAKPENLVDIQRYDAVIRFKRWLRHFVA